MHQENRGSSACKCKRYAPLFRPPNKAIISTTASFLPSPMVRGRSAKPPIPAPRVAARPPDLLVRNTHVRLLLSSLSLCVSPRPRRPLPSRRHGLRYFPFSPPCASLFHRWPVVASPGVCCCWFGSWTFADIGFLNRVCDPLLQFSSFFSRLFNCWPPGQLRI